MNAKMQRGLPIICEEMELKKCDGGEGGGVTEEADRLEGL